MKMSDAYLFVSYKQAADPSRLAAYGALAVQAIEQFGGTVIARAEPSHIYEAGQSELTVLVRFNSVDEAAALYDTQPIAKRWRRSAPARAGTCGSSPPCKG
jgi:uncharacterized protein (DUF1330 family)